MVFFPKMFYILNCYRWYHTKRVHNIFERDSVYHNYDFPIRLRTNAYTGVITGRSQLEGISNYTIKKTDDLTGIRSIISEIKPEAVFHLAGMTDATDLHELYLVNTIYSATILKALSQEKLWQTKIILYGSAAEYGYVLPSELPVSESHHPQPFNHYGISKYAQTLNALSRSQAGQRILVIRPFTVIGKGMPEHLAIGSFIAQIIFAGCC